MLVPVTCTEDSRLDSPVFDLLRHGQKGLLYIRGILRRCFKEGDGELVGEVLTDVSDSYKLDQIRRNARRTFAAPYSTTFLLVRSDLLPTSNLFTPSEA